ncbi:ribonuclease P protein component [Paremcibacter congregatus]|uniref:Ribonuclease P protein component n=1 Tax=Paremcibacter congregatus TaxID=2043170 RepID=A0A2G4YWD6_9PROT|nr:ribonuclease P protein component [Paremcibacter congregatus]PHZ86629.1 ribonuclease P protein component [Paremcibacter congregatus]QDE26431.1 ribonuclease P protein component [Paremcibacter congregatus]|tara:strand:- start:17293 stop:17748 length:456 start_codon:yes stop_codon:yes gene_type:complete
MSQAALSLSVLKKRPDFLRVAATQVKWVSGSLIVQMAPRPDQAAAHTTDIRVGYTASKKVGNAVARVRAKRRLREVARAVLPEQGRAGTDYVLIARTATVDVPYDQLIRDLRWCVRRLHEPRDPDKVRNSTGRKSLKRREKPDLKAEKGDA